MCFTIFDDEIDVALPVPPLHVRQPVPLRRQRPQGLDEELQPLRLHRQLVGLRAKDRPFDGYPVAGVEVLVQLPITLRYGILAYIRLHAAGLLGEDQERGLAEGADGHDSAGDPDVRFLRLELVVRLRLVFRHQIDDCRIDVRSGREGVVSELRDPR